jgi:alkylhydroperoxidase family enzyme
MPLKSKQPRIVPLEPPFDAVAADALERLGPPIGLFRVWARRPELVRGVAGWGRYYFSPSSALTVRQRELVIHRTTALCGAGYEWGVHVATFAEKAGFDAEQIRSLAAVDELRATCDLADGTWADLVEAVGEDGALDVLLVCGWYHAISFTVRALRLPPEPGAPVPGFAEMGDC